MIFRKRLKNVWLILILFLNCFTRVRAADLHVTDDCIQNAKTICDVQKFRTLKECLQYKSYFHRLESPCKKQFGPAVIDFQKSRQKVAQAVDKQKKFAKKMGSLAEKFEVYRYGEFKASLQNSADIIDPQNLRNSLFSQFFKLDKDESFLILAAILVVLIISIPVTWVFSEKLGIAGIIGFIPGLSMLMKAKQVGAYKEMGTIVGCFIFLFFPVINVIAGFVVFLAIFSINSKIATGFRSGPLCTLFLTFLPPFAYAYIVFMNLDFRSIFPAGRRIGYA